MKKLLHYADCLILLAAIIGCALRLWFGNAGLDNQGLHRPGHPAWILLCVLSLGVVAFTFFVTRDPGDNQRHGDNYPRSIPGAAGNILLAIGLGYSGMMDLLAADGLLEAVAAVVCMMSAVCLGVAGVERFSGNQPVFFVHMVPCAYFTLRLCLLGRDLGTDPDVCGFLFQFLASLAMIPALLWRWSFDVGLGNRRNVLFFSLCALYFCLVTTFEVSTGWLMYLLYAAFLLTNLCSLRYLPAPAEEPAEEAEEETPGQPEAAETQEITEEATKEVVEEVPEEVTEEAGEVPVEEKEEAAAEEVAQQEQEVPAKEPETRKKAELHGDIDPEADMAAFLADIKRFLEDQES